MKISQIYPIKGMHCASCGNIIEKTLKKVEGVEDVSVNYGTEKAKISFDDSKIKIEELSKKIEPLGYSFAMLQGDNMQTAESMGMPAHAGMSESEHAEHLGLSQTKKEKLDELASMRSKVLSVASLVVFSVFVMAWGIFAEFDLVSRIPSTWGNFFNQVFPIFAIYTFFVIGKPYLLGVYRFLRYGKANMDTLIGIGTSVAFIYSFILTIFSESLSSYLNVENIYYDLTIIVLAFIAFGKHLAA